MTFSDINQNKNFQTIDLYEAITALAALNGVKRDTIDPFEVMPKDIDKIVLKYRGKFVDIPKTAKNLFNNPGFICSDVKKFWKGVKKDSKGYIVDAAHEFRVKIVYLDKKTSHGILSGFHFT